MFVLLIILIFLGYQFYSDPALYDQYNAVGIAITQFILIVYSIVYFYRSLSKALNELIIVNIGVFVYLICSTLIFASGNFFDFKFIPESGYTFLWQLNGIFYIVFQILIFIEWYRNYRAKNG